MAVTYLTEEQRKQQQAMQPQTAQQPAQAYSGMRGVTQNTAQNVGRYQNGYQESERVQNARNLLEQNNAAKPQGYNSKYGEQLEQILQKITNPEGFKYSFAGDALFNSARDIAVQNGKQAAMDVAGQAAALTGGYGSSYGQNVGQQAYNSYLQNLNDIVPELYDRAYQQYSDDFNRDVTAYQTAYEADNNAYNRYNNEREYWTGRNDTEYNKMLTNAANMAAMGDFSGYAALYGDEAANRMYNSWVWQNEDLARKLGYLK